MTLAGMTANSVQAVTSIISAIIECIKSRNYFNSDMLIFYDYYEYSSKIAVHLMNGEQLHGITYPSIILSNQSQNFALKIECADKVLSLVHCTAYVIKSIEHPLKFDVEEYNFGVNNNGMIHWTSRKKQWSIKKNGGQLTIEANGWQWEAYDINNKLVDPE
jgi:hypothetical protein